MTASMVASENYRCNIIHVTLGIQVATMIFYWYWSYTNMHMTHVLLTDLWVFDMTKKLI